MFNNDVIILLRVVNLGIFYICPGAVFAAIEALEARLRLFDDISAFASRTFRYHWKRLLADPHFIEVVEGLMATLQKKHPTPDPEHPNRGWRRSIPLAFRNLGQGARHWLKKIGWIRSYMAFRSLMQYAVGSLIEHTTKGLSYSGHRQPFFRSHRLGICFLSSHRSTALDSALTNYVLHHEFRRSTYNAAGDNIFVTPWLGNIIRLNKGFIVKRSIEDPDEKLNEAGRLSSYINILLKKKEWVWIAHRNGRSKDGRDRSDSAVLSMLKMGSEHDGWGEFSAGSYLVPVSMSWELVPMDLEIAQELAGELGQRDPARDAKNILGEIVQTKGRIHIHFSHPVSSEKRADLVRQLDGAIHRGMRLWESNYVAWLRLLEAEGMAASELAFLRAQLEACLDLSKADWILDRAKGLKPEAQEHFLAMYAGPVKNALDLYGDLGAVLKTQGSMGFL